MESLNLREALKYQTR